MADEWDDVFEKTIICHVLEIFLGCFHHWAKCGGVRKKASSAHEEVQGKLWRGTDILSVNSIYLLCEWMSGRQSRAQKGSQERRADLHNLTHHCQTNKSLRHSGLKMVHSPPATLGEACKPKDTIIPFMLSSSFYKPFPLPWRVH